MSIRRKSTTHDLATLRLHPDGSRVQQSSANARHRTAGSTVVDVRGNWIAKDAGGKSSVKTRRRVSGTPMDNADGESIDLSGDEEGAHGRHKGKRPVRGSQTPEEPPQEQESERLNTRARRRLSFMRDLSFLDPPPASVSTLEEDTRHSDVSQATVSFADPASDLLKSIHHFASCYYRERGQLFDSSRGYRGKKKERYKQSRENIHTLAANTLDHRDTSSETEHSETGDETSEEDETSGDDDGDENEAIDLEDSGKGGPNTKVDTYKKDMYRAFDGSALMAIGIVLQEYVAHTLSSGLHTVDEPQSPKRRRTE